MPNVKRRLAVAGLCLLATAPPAAAAKWVEVKSPNFTVYSDAGEREAREVAQQFEQVRLAFERLWSGARTRTAKPIVILAARDQKSLRALLPDYFERKDAKQVAGITLAGAHKIHVALAADDRGEDAFARLGYNPYQVHFHEYIHVLVSLNMQGVPPWLGEGLAEFFGATIVEGDRLVIGKPLPWHIYELRERAMLPLERLVAVDHDSPEYTQHGQAGVFYAQSWALLHMLVMDPSGDGARRRINGLLRRLRRGEDAQQASRAELGDLAALDKQLGRYVRRPGFQYTRNDFDARVSAKSFPAREVTPAEALAVQGDFHAHRGQDALAHKLLEQALQQDPKLALAHEALGYLAWREKSLAEALPHFKRAAESGGGFLPHFLLATALLEQDTPEALEQAQGALAKAVELDPEHARAHEALARVIGRRDGDMARAVELAQRAVSLEPLDPDLRLTLSWLLDKAGRRDDAQAEARRAVAVARSDRRQRAQAWLDRLAGTAAPPAASAPAGQAVPVARPRRPPAEQEQACSAGQLAECFALADRHASGDGVGADPARALGLYDRACDGGLADACLSLAGAHLAGTLGTRDPGAAVAAMGRACDAGHALSCAHAGLMLSMPSEVPRDDARAAGFLKKGCQAEVAPACGGLALLHLGGRGGLARDAMRGAALLEQACGAGEPSSCANLAGLYEAGVGVAKNAARAGELYAGACAKGVQSACAKAPARVK